MAQGGAATATISGTVTGSSGPLANVDVTLAGPAYYRTSTDATGSFSIQNVNPGLYTVSFVHGGYLTVQEDIAVVAGEAQAINVTMQVASFSSLQTIAHVRALGRGVFNTTAASINTITAATMQDQAAYDAFQLFDEVPGVNINLASSSANGADPAAVSIPEVRGALPYETAMLIDGHPLANGSFGDYVSTYMYLPVVMQNLAVTKGPGQLAPVLNNAIGGTLNVETYDPTLNFTPDYIFGFDNLGGTYSLLGVSDTILDGRLGIVARVGTRNEPSADNGQQVWLGQNTNDQTYFNYGRPDEDQGYYNDTKGNIPGTDSRTYNQFNLVECCWTLQGYVNTTSELVKLRYRFSPSTFLTASYINSDFQADQNATTVAMTPSVFSPLGPYQGPRPNGNGDFLMSNVYAAPNTITNDEPIFEVDFSSAIGQDTFLARWYHATINRINTQGIGPDQPNTYDWAVYGYNNNYSTPYPTYDGQTIPVASFQYFLEDEIDHLQGYEAQYIHPYGEGSNFTASWNNDQVSSWYWEEATDLGSVCKYCTYNTPTSSPYAYQYASNIPLGTNSITNTFSVTDTTSLTSRLVFDAGLYEDLYRNTYPIGCTTPTGAYTTCTQYTGMNPNGSNTFWKVTTPTHFDDRMGLVWHASDDASIRFTAGSSIAPPYLDILSLYDTTPSYSSTNGYATQAFSNPLLKPETAFGYDLGADFRVIDPVTFAKIDLYSTTIYNHFLEQYYNVGTCSATPGTMYCGSASDAGAPIIGEQWVNISNARMEGMELTLQRVPGVGFGYYASASLEHAYAYDLPPGFYCSFGAVVTPHGGTTKYCSPKYYNTNLAVIPGNNFTGNGVDTSDGQNGLGTGYSVPYLQAYGRIDWRSPGGFYASFGEQLIGKNNWANEPAFWVGSASVRIPVSRELSIQVSGWNIFNTLSGLYPIVGGGVPIQLACTNVSYHSSTSTCSVATSSGTLGATEGNVLGPARWKFLLVKNFGPNP